ncbi:tape measure protein [Bacteroides sp. CG01]|uniref:tape measure protein n=1 Tax=Bacteroides sp. CG01 TaxID=3096000 RepID=UPI002AFEACBE|nr:tape measure protein [Bacteroides sp. CG01]
MAGRLSFSIAINFLTENFKRGTSQVKAAFKSMQMQFLTFAAALGAGGLGLSNFVSRLIDVARETNRVTTALKNVSGGMAQFADNQRFLIDMAKKYGLEINALTGNFAKFTAAASISGISMMDQRKIFESVSRAVTAFGMSADDSNGVFLALSQMMSKGKISSEELRLQMGERLPIALQAMAKAAGTSVAGLDKLMKQGKLMSADILPKFANALNEMIPNVDTDNLETSVNRLKNVFTELVNGTDVQSKYKALIDWLAGCVQKASDNIRSIITYLVAAILVMVTSRLVNKIIIAISQAELAAKSAARRTAKETGQKFNEVEWKANKMSASVRMAFKRAISSIKATLISLAPTAILSVIGAVVAKLYNAYEESKRIKGLFDEYKGRIDNVSESHSEIIKIKSLQSAYNAANVTLSEKKSILSQINSILGTQLTVNQDVNKVIADRIAILEGVARAELAAQEVASSENELRKIGKKSYNGKSIKDMAPDWAMARGDMVKEEKFKAKYKVSMVDAVGWENGLRNDLDSFIEYAKILKDAKGRLDSEKIKVDHTTSSIIESDDDKKKTTLQKQQESYDKQLEELGAELEIGKITQAEYNKSLGELSVKMFTQAKGTGDKDVLESEYYQNLKMAAEKAVKDQDKNAALVEFERIQKGYSDKVKEYQVQFGKGLISQKELNENLASLALDAAKSAAGIKGIGNEANLFIAAMQMNAEMLKSPIKIEPRDTTFDYKKGEVDIATENLDKAKEYADKLKEQARSIGKTLSDEIANAIANVPTLEEALKLAQVKQDIKNFTKELNEGVYSGIKEIAGSSDRVVNAFSQLRDIMNDVDASGWEKVMAVWNAMTNVVDSFLSIAKMIENMTDLTNKLVKAKETETAIESAATAAKVTNITTETAALATQAVTEVAASTAKAGAASVEMAAKSTAAYAAIPFVGVGLAEAQIAAMQSLIAMAAVPKFANGGIVTGGPTSGDKILARVNAGEMILNQSQQSRLWQAIQSGRTMAGTPSVSQSMTTKVRGKDLLLTINNELKSQGKKPL